MSKINNKKSPPQQKVEEKTIKKIVRRAKGDKKASSLRLYFSSDTQDAIIEYQKSSLNEEKSKIYVQKIMPAFDKLVENLINIHRFSGLHDTYDDLKHDCVSFLYETICKYDSNRGTKAFSYFNVVAKNWLIVKTKHKSIKAKKSVSLDDPDSLSNNETKIVDEYCSIQSQDLMLENKSSSEAIIKMMYEIRDMVRTENELICINSIITVFENIEELDLLNKGAIFLYIRELSGLTPKQLTTAMQSIKKCYGTLKEDPDFEIFNID